MQDSFEFAIRNPPNDYKNRTVSVLNYDTDKEYKWVDTVV